MSRLTRLQTRLAKVQSRISEIEDAYPTLAKHKSFSRGFGEVSSTYQDFGPLADEYHRLLQLEEALEEEIAEWQESESGSTYVAAFRGVSQ